MAIRGNPSKYMTGLAKAQYLLSLNDNQLAAISKSLSPPRFNAYRQKVASDHDALALYAVNQRLAAHIFELIGDFEVALRNAVLESLKATVKEGDWFDSPSIRLRLKKYHSKQIEDAIAHLLSMKRQPDSDRLCAAMNLGFWLGFYAGPLGDDLWPRHLSKHWPKGTSLKVLRQDLHHVRELRNRIAHHESIYAPGWRHKRLSILRKRFEQLAPEMYQFASSRFDPRFRQLDDSLDAAGL